MRVLRAVLILVVAVLIACPVVAQEKKKGRRGGARGSDPTARLLEGLNLTDEQKAKVEEVSKELAPKVAELRKKQEGILTDEQKKAREEALKEARSAGKSRQETAKAVEDAVKLTDEQKAKRAEVGKEMADLQKTRMEKIKAFLTAEQKEQLEKRIEELKSKMGKGKKKAN